MERDRERVEREREGGDRKQEGKKIRGSREG